MALRECLDCGRLHNGTTRCPDCSSSRERARDQQRGTRHQRGLGYDHEQARKQLLEDQPMCHWCGVRPATHADHVKHRSQNGTNEIENYVPACAPCNLSRGNRATPKGQGGPP